VRLGSRAPPHDEVCQSRNTRSLLDLPLFGCFYLGPNYLHVLLFFCFCEPLSQVDPAGVTLHPPFDIWPRPLCTCSADGMMARGCSYLEAYLGDPSQVPSPGTVASASASPRPLRTCPAG